MAIDIKCRLIDKLAVQSGTSARGPWSKQDFIVETQEQYPRKICMNVWGDEKVSELGSFNNGEIIIASVNIESREFNGRWYTDVRAWKIQRESASNATPENVQEDPFMSVSGNVQEDDGGDLPF
jgi:Protein of unknown function (DUF3127).